MRGHFQRDQDQTPDFMDLSGSAEMGEWISAAEDAEDLKRIGGFRNRRRSDLHARPLQGRPGRWTTPIVDADGAEGIRLDKRRNALA